MRTRARLYRVLLWLYPPSFRREYREPMLQLFEDLHHHRRARTVWIRIARDVAVTLPFEYWEAFMASTSMTRTIITVSVTAAAVGVALVVGASFFGLLLMLLLAWQLYAVLKMRGTGISSTQWSRFVLAGAAVFGLIFVVFALPWPEAWRSEVPGDLAYFLVLWGIALSIVLVVTGTMLGIAHLARRHHRHATEV